MQSSQGSTLVARATQAHQTQPPVVPPRPNRPGTSNQTTTTHSQTTTVAQPVITSTPTPPPVTPRPVVPPRQVAVQQPANPQTQAMVRVALPPAPAQRQPLVPTQQPLQVEFRVDPVKYDAMAAQAMDYLDKALAIHQKHDREMAAAKAQQAEGRAMQAEGRAMQAEGQRMIDEAQAERAQAQAEKAKMAYLKPRIQELTNAVLLAFGSIFQVTDVETIKRFSPEQNPIAMSKPDYLLKLKGPNGLRDFYCDPYDPANIKFYLKNMSQIVAFLDANPSVRSCDFHQIKGIESGIAQFAEKLKTSSVSSVKFGNIEINDADLRALASVRQSNSRISFSFESQTTAARFRQISS